MARGIYFFIVELHTGGAGPPRASRWYVGSSCRKDLATRVQVVLRVCLLKLQTGKQRKGLRWKKQQERAQVGLLGSVRNKRRELPGRSEKRGVLETGLGSKPGMSRRCPLLPRLQLSWGPLEFRRRQRRDTRCGLLWQEPRGRSPRVSRNTHQLPRCVLQCAD